jgi:hypothetical protein
VAVASAGWFTSSDRFDQRRLVCCQCRLAFASGG